MSQQRRLRWEGIATLVSAELRNKKQNALFSGFFNWIKKMSRQLKKTVKSETNREGNGINWVLKLILDSAFVIICIYPGVSVNGTSLMAYSTGLFKMKT